MSTKALVAVKPGREITYDDAFNRIVANGVDEAVKDGSKTLNSEHLILGILSNDKQNDTITKMLRKAGLIYKTFAEKIGVKQVTYSTWERGSSEPSASAIAAIALACGVSTDWLLGVDSCSPPDKRIADLKQAIITYVFYSKNKCYII